MSKEKIARLKDSFAVHNLQGFIFSNNDEFNNEYPPEGAQRINFLTGFSGSRALCIVLVNAAAIFVDGRYTLQANEQVDKDVFQVLNHSEHDIKKFLNQHVHAGQHVGINTKITSIKEYNFFNNLLQNNNQAVLVPLNHHLVDDIWPSKPKYVHKPAFIHSTEYAGLGYKEKIQQVQEVLKANKLNGFLFTDLPSICWLLNIRGQDVPNNPYLLSYCYVNAEGVVKVFCNLRSINNIKESLGGIIFVDIKDMENYLENLKPNIGLDEETLVYFSNLFSNLGIETTLLKNPIEKLKAQKNSIEIASIKQAHVNDGVALTRLLYNLHQNPQNYNEISIDTELQNIKQQLYPNHYIEDSFSAIVGINSNGAIVHYRATAHSNRSLMHNDYLLLDTGSQYLQGTTDVTRSVSFNKQSDEYKFNFTMVLKGLIAVCKINFPHGTTDGALDSLARQFLWQHKLNYNHGTGHGVGMFLGVHEGPISVSSAGRTILQPGMVFSVEPGYYKENEYGIRLENLVLVSSTAGNTNNNDAGNYLNLETLTLVPFDCKNILTQYLQTDEINFLNQYHTSMQNSIFEYLTPAEQEWFIKYTKIS